MPPEMQHTSDSDIDSIIAFPHHNNKSKSSTVSSKYKCTIDGCDAIFKRLDHLDRHEYHHNGIKKHCCDYDGCNKSYSILTHLKRHLRTTHERDAPMQKNIACTIEKCDKLFTSTTNMKKHIREVHENPKIYNCPDCNDKFTQKLKMRRHIIKNHTKEYPYNCSKCSKGFFQEWQYESHHSACKIYPCSNCNEKFDKWSLYIKHCKDMKHGRKYYKCEHCERSYNRPGELHKHIVAKHMDMPMESFKCPHSNCDRTYSYERNLKQHIRTAHDGKKFECKNPKCMKSFSSAQNLTKHINREHKRKRDSSNNEDEETIEDGNVDVDKNIQTDKIKNIRKKRKDAGQSIISNLAQLSGISVDRGLDKLLRERDAVALDFAANVLAKELESTDTETN